MDHPVHLNLCLNSWTQLNNVKKDSQFHTLFSQCTSLRRVFIDIWLVSTLNWTPCICKHLKLNWLEDFSIGWIVVCSGTSSPHFITHICSNNPFKKYQPLLHNIVCLAFRQNITFNEPPRNFNGNAPVSRIDNLTSNPIKSPLSIETNRPQRCIKKVRQRENGRNNSRYLLLH